MQSAKQLWQKCSHNPTYRRLRKERDVCLIEQPFDLNRVGFIKDTDDLRAKYHGWDFAKEPSGLEPSRRMARASDRDEIVYLCQTLTIPAMRKLAARDQALETYGAQYALLEQQQLTLGEVEAQLAAVPVDDQVEGFVILVPQKYEQEAV
jgi:hypothetical protein